MTSVLLPGLAPLSRLEEQQLGTHWHLMTSCAAATELPAALLLTWIMAGLAPPLIVGVHVAESLTKLIFYAAGKGGAGLSFDRLLTRRDCFVSGFCNFNLAAST
jgi:hypothetical protein